MVDETQAADDMPQETPAPDAQASYSHIQREFQREHVADRTGELIEAAVSTAEKYQKVGVMMLEEPETGVSAPVAISREGVVTIPPHTFDPYRAAPKRRTGKAVMTRIDSFIDHVNRFKDEDSALFACDNRDAPSLTAVLDYHEALNSSPDGGFDDVQPGPSPRFGGHRTYFAFPLSDEWKAWMAGDKQVMGMVEFAQFLEDRIIDVELIDDTKTLNADIQQFIKATNGAIAGQSKLMELSKGLAIHEDSAVQEVRNLQTGEAQVMFASEHKDSSGAPLKVPGLFIICIPVFAHDGYYRIAARLRYRKESGGIVFWYELWRTDRVFDDAFGTACDKAKSGTGLPLVFGAPE